MQQRTVPTTDTRLERAARRVDKAEGKARTLRFVASDETVDRYGDIIRADGWQLDTYHHNPVLLFAHDSRAPIGNAKVWVENKSLLADATFAPEGKSALADEIWNLVDADVVRAVSVGFLPTVAPNVMRGEPDKNGYAPIIGFEFIGQELLELSVVSVPANPAALALARSLASDATIRRLFIPDPSALAQVAAEQRRRSITLTRLGRA